MGDQMRNEFACQVRYFAGAAAAAGVEEESVRLVPPVTVAELKQRLVRNHPGLETVLPVCSLLIDAVVSTRDDAELTSPTMVDVLPPFAGG